MDTKSKKNNAIGRFLGFLVITILSILLLEGYQPIYRYARSLEEKTGIDDDVYEQILKDEFILDLYTSNYVLNYSVKQANTKYGVTASEVFFQETSKEEILFDPFNSDQFIFQMEDNFYNNFNNIILRWYEEFYSSIAKTYPSFLYYIIDHETGKVVTNADESMATLLDMSKENLDFKDNHPFYLVLKTIEDGTLSMFDYKGIEFSYIDELITMNRNNERMGDEISSLIDYDSDYDYYQCHEKVKQLRMPSNISIIYASGATDFYDGGFYPNQNSRISELLFIDAGYHTITFIAVILVVLFACFLPLIRPLHIGNGIAAKVPLEINVVLLTTAAMILRSEYPRLIWSSIHSDFLFTTEYTIIPESIQRVMVYGLNALILMIMLGIWYLGTLSLRQLVTVGFKSYLKEKTILGRLFCFIIKKVKGIIITVTSIDFTDSYHKKILQLLGLNFVLLSIISCFWFFGILLLIPYTICIFLYLRKYLNGIKNHYSLLLEASSQIANGNLELSISQDLGVFEPIKDELTKIQQGFSKAVKEELKSERMKTELITNVSHDLKTPLTAIITYIGLLKNENISTQERLDYIETLDKKSQRLKVLIEDLFEVSKATSNNLSLQLVEVDLANLIKQVLLELDDKIAAASLDLRLNLPEKKVLLMLDSEKTYRIFENLIHNVTKYALPHTRAYIDMMIKEKTVEVIIKNVSATELNFCTEEITDRFVRGDLSRNTEGSGLGLAITKSFVELQGGKFKIVADGDLFKANIEWKLN